MPTMPPDDTHRIAAYHNAVRHECEQRIARARAAYEALYRAGRATIALASGGWDYTDEAHALFPRYNVLEAILVDVERVDPTKFTDLDEARALLSLAAQTASGPFTVAANHIAARAMSEERASFVAFVETSPSDDWERRPRLPYRRGLEARERHALVEAFEARWGRWYGGVGDRADVGPHVTVGASRAMTDKATEAVRRALGALGVERLFELRELGESFERELAGTDFQYTSSGEGFWFTRDLDWAIYASHEDTVTFAGSRLLSALRDVAPSLLAKLL